ncbi:hypothetical protein LMG33818_001023 [Halomonadaceae bacterium LMG 33818]|uniref:DUF481 domain-containing protein n=1 Tax=Cernens ardua TaxID=3402176 RepID=UPI003EDBAC56
MTPFSKSGFLPTLRGRHFAAKLPTSCSHPLLTLGLALALPVASCPAYAETNYTITDFATLVTPSKVDRDFDGQVQFGFNENGGNDTTRTLNGSTNLTWYRKKWTYNFNAYTYASGTKKTHTDERYVFAGRTRYNLDQDSFLFSQVRLSFNRFSGYQNQLSIAGGYGRQLIDTKRNSLDVDIGPGIRRDKLKRGPIYYRPLAYLGFDYKYTLSDRVSLEQNAGVEVAGRSMATHSDTSLNVGLNKDFTLRLEYLIDYNSNPPANATYATDTTTTVSLQYNF